MITISTETSPSLVRGRQCASGYRCTAPADQIATSAAGERTYFCVSTRSTPRSSAFLSLALPSWRPGRRSRLQ